MLTLARTGELSSVWNDYLETVFKPNVVEAGFNIEHPDQPFLQKMLQAGELRGFSKLLQQRFGVPVYQGDREARKYDGAFIVPLFRERNN